MPVVPWSVADDHGCKSYGTKGTESRAGSFRAARGPDHARHLVRPGWRAVHCPGYPAGDVGARLYDHHDDGRAARWQRSPSRSGDLTAKGPRVPSRSDPGGVRDPVEPSGRGATGATLWRGCVDRVRSPHRWVGSRAEEAAPGAGQAVKRYAGLIGGATLLGLACGSWLTTCRLPG